MCRHGVRFPMATILLVRNFAHIIADEPKSQSATDYDELRPFFDFLEAGLRHRSDIVLYEAARAIATLPDVTPSELQPAVAVLQRFLFQAKPSLRFAAICTLNSIASTQPLAATSRNADMEVLIADHSYDEVRDRATLFNISLGLDVCNGKGEAADPAFVAELQDETRKLLSLPCPIANLEAQMLIYVASGASDKPFDIETV